MFSQLAEKMPDNFSVVIANHNGISKSSCHEVFLKIPKADQDLGMDPASVPG